MQGSRMNFFHRQAQARSSSQRLVWLFALAVVGIVAVIDLAVYAAMSAKLAASQHPDEGIGMVGALAIATILVLATIGIASLVRIAQLRSGGWEVALDMGGVQVVADTTDPSLRRLRNVVEEIAIASGVPMPDVFVMEKENGINAFAAGYGPDDAAIAVTRGALRNLNRDELQGVVAHEFSHVLNGDMRLNIRLMGILFGILMLGVIGRKMLQHMRHGSDSRGALPLMAAGMALMLVGSIGLFFGRLIKAGVSRSREQLADASAVQFTRQTSGLAGALKKIAGVPAGSRLDNAKTEEVSHMLFGEGLGFSSWFATHPPILERIRALDPSFDAQGLEHLRQRYLREPPSGASEDLALGFAPDGTRVPAGAGLPDARSHLAVSGDAVVAQVGTPAQDDFERAGAIAVALDEELRALARQRESAATVTLALLIDRDRELAARQFEEIAQRIDIATAKAVRELYPRIAALHPMLRLPLAELAFPQLRRRPRPELMAFLECCRTLIRSDGKVGLFEYCLERLLRRQVIEALDPSRHAPNGRRKLIEAKPQVALLFAVVARHGHDSDAEARRAYAAGFSRVFPQSTLAYAPPADFVAALDEALPKLDALDPLSKRLLIEGLTAAIGHDGRIAVAEAELLRTVCAVLHCPVPAMMER